MSACVSKAGKAYTVFCMVLGAIICLIILLLLLVYSWPAIYQQGSALFTLQWNPAGAKFGIVSMVFGSFTVTIVALTLAIPLGLATAVFLSEILPGKYRFYVKSLLELLAGIPSILYGLIGIAFLSEWLKDYFVLTTGRTLFTAALLLAVMILPTLITLTDDALHNIPQKYRETARGLGLYRYEVILGCILPMAKVDVCGAILLSLGRVLGETMAVMLVIGGIDKIPQPVFNLLLPGQTLTSKLGREIAESAFGSMHFSALIFMGLILLLMVLVLTAVSQYYVKVAQRLYE